MFILRDVQHRKKMFLAQRTMQKCFKIINKHPTWKRQERLNYFLIFRTGFAIYRVFLVNCYLFYSLSYKFIIIDRAKIFCFRCPNKHKFMLLNCSLSSSSKGLDVRLLLQEPSCSHWVRISSSVNERGVKRVSARQTWFRPPYTKVAHSPFSVLCSS